MRFYFFYFSVSLFLLSCSQAASENNGVEIQFDFGTSSEKDSGPTLNSWDACRPDSHVEELVYLDRSVDDLIAEYDPNDYHHLVNESLKRRAPFGAWIIEEVLQTQSFDCIEEYAASYAPLGALEVLENTTTIVHECSHALNMATWNGTTHDYFVRFDEVYRVPIIEGPGRRVIKDYLLWEDNYSDVYLDLSGEQHFDMVLEEVNGYVNGLVAGIAFADLAYEGKQISVRDGTATLLLYMAIYLHHTRLNDNTVYMQIVNEEAMRLAILTLWDRSKLALKLAAPYPEIGINDVKILAELEKFEEEITRVRNLHCGN